MTVMFAGMASETPLGLTQSNVTMETQILGMDAVAIAS